jgi:hypothetical protein
MLAALILALAPACAVGDPCAGAQLAGRCIWVRGRLSAWNGTPTFRIWPIGTRRMLGVVGPDGAGLENLPAPAVGVAAGEDLFSVRIVGRWRICPLTKRRAGWMQYVCVSAARDLRVVPYRP